MLMFNDAFGIAAIMLAQVVLHGGTWWVLGDTDDFCHAEKVLHWGDMGRVEL